MIRTTVEITEEQRAELLKIAAKRRLKGFSHLVQEALEEYLQKQTSKQQIIDAALELKGSLSQKNADHLQETVSNLRKSWR